MPWTHRSAVLPLVVAVLLAGCSTPFDASPAESTPEQSVTPPGVANETLANESALLEAHVVALSERGYRLETTTGDVRTVFVAEPDYSSFRVIPDEIDSKPAVWANESVTLARLTRDGDVEFREPPRSWASARQMTGADVLEVLLEGGAYRRTGTVDCGDRECAVLAAATHSRYEPFDAEAHVDDDGVVHRFDATFTREGEGGPIEVEYRLRVTKLENVTVDRPPWLETAIERTG